MRFSLSRLFPVLLISMSLLFFVGCKKLVSDGSELLEQIMVPVDEVEYSFTEMQQVSFWQSESWVGPGQNQGKLVWDGGNGFVNRSQHKKGAMFWWANWQGVDEQFLLTSDFSQQILDTQNLAHRYINFSCVDIHLRVFMPQVLVEDGQLGIKLFMKDYAGKYATYGWLSAAQMRANDWQRFEFISVAAQDLDFTEQDFDISKVQTIGFNILANGKQPSIGQEQAIGFDDFKIKAKRTAACISPPPEQTLLNLELASAPAIKAWQGDFVSQDVVYSLNQKDQAMALAIFWQNPVTDKLLLPRDIDTLDIQRKSISLNVYLPKAYADEGKLGFKVYVKDSAQRYASLGWQSVGALKGDEWNTIRISNIEDSADSFDYQSPGFDMQQVSFLGIEVIANGTQFESTEGMMVKNIRVLAR